MFVNGLKSYNTVVKGGIFNETNRDAIITNENVWWLLNSCGQYVAAYCSEITNSLCELNLKHCQQLWGQEPQQVTEDEANDNNLIEIIVNGTRKFIPTISSKYADFVRRRRKIFLEIRNMRNKSNHINVIRLESVLEFTQESTSTIFLVTELADGGELFDMIDRGTSETIAQYFFGQLILGVKHCHDHGVCHRDLKPEVFISF
jgi:serine/threonine protein kinase